MKSIPIIIWTVLTAQAVAFVVPVRLNTAVAPISPSQAGAVGPLFVLPTVDSMRISEIREELESYGVSTASFLEKKEMVEALNKARSDGKKPIKEEFSEQKESKDKSRDDRLKSQMEKASKMRIGDLRKELDAMGISTKSFFEKTEFVKAYAEAVVDGVASKTSSKSRSEGSTRKEEPFDPSYRDVTMQKFDRRDPRLLQFKVIDVRLSA